MIFYCNQEDFPTQDIRRSSSMNDMNDKDEVLIRDYQKSIEQMGTSSKTRAPSLTPQPRTASSSRKP
eukprot:Pgem_evm1s13367